MRRKMKSVMALLLSLTMAQNLVPMAALAAGTDNLLQEVETETILQSEDDIDNSDVEVTDETAEAKAAESAVEADTEAAVVETEQVVKTQKAAKTEKSETETDAAAQEDELKELLSNALFLSNDTVVDISGYDVPAEELQSITDDLLEEGNVDGLMEVSFSVDKKGAVENMVVEASPEIEAVKDELDRMKADGKPLTTEEKYQIMGLYGQYLKHYEDNVQYLGMLDPYFTTKETNSEMGILGSMLVLIGYTVEQVEKGACSFDEIMGAIQALYFGNVFGVQFYGQQLLAVKDEAMKAVKDSGATTEVDKLLVLTDWLCQHSSFELEFIVDMYSKGCKNGALIMNAEEPAVNPHMGQIKAAMYEMLYPNYQAQYGEMASAYASMAAEQMAGAVVSSWSGNLFGTLCLKRSACTGYAGALSYLVQWMHPEVYGVNGANTDLSKAENWKSRDELYYITEKHVQKDAQGKDMVDAAGKPIVVETKTFSTDAPYLVDYGRLIFQSQTRTHGEVDYIQSQHYFNAVKVDGKWYYVDAGFVDAYSEFMERNRVETDGDLNHMLFMMSDTSMRTFYDGYILYMDTLYGGVATDESYENAWFTYAKSGVSVKNGSYYYTYNSTDRLAMLKHYLSGGVSSMSELAGYVDQKIALVRHDRKDGSANTFTELVNITEGTVLNPATGKMVESPLVKELGLRMHENSKKYPLITPSSALYGNRLYFNLDNCILYYDLNTGNVVKVKEYNTVGAKRDKSAAVGGSGFYVTDLKDADYTVTNAPIAGMTIKSDGKMYVDIATNYSFIAGKSRLTDTSSYGYEYEETNFNPNYAGYNKKFSFGTDTVNDNEEFEWCANFVEVLDMAHLSGNAHNYTKVEVDPFCGMDGYTEERCSTCGAIRADSRKVNAGTACEHHYVRHNETYYTGKSGVSYVCTICKDAQSNGYETPHVYEEPDADAVEWSDDYTTAVIKGYGCKYCTGKKLDCVVGDANLKAEDVICTQVSKIAEGTCDEGIKNLYTAEGIYRGYKISVQKTVTEEPKAHDYNEEGICKICGAEKAPERPVETSKMTGASNLSAGGVKISWEKMKDAVGYQIYRKAVGKGWSSIAHVDGGDIVSYTDSTAKSGKQYTYTVRAYYEAYEIAMANKYDTQYWSEHDKTGASVICLSAPVMEKPSNSSLGVQVAWSKVTGAAGYRIYRKSSKDAGWKKVKTISSAKTLDWIDTSSGNGKEYWYTVKAYAKNDGQTWWSGRAVLDKSVVRLNTSSITSLTAGTGKFAVKWNKNSKVEGYQVKYATNKNFTNAKTSKVNGNAQVSKTVKNLKKGTYYVCVRSFKKAADGKTSYSAWSSVKKVKVVK